MSSSAAWHSAGSQLLYGLLGSLALSGCESDVILGAFPTVLKAASDAGPGRAIAVTEQDKLPQASIRDASVPQTPPSALLPPAPATSETPQVDVQPVGMPPLADAATATAPPAADAAVAPAEGEDAQALMPQRTPMPACGQQATAEAPNEPGLGFGSTETATEWTLASPARELSWEFMIEQEPPPHQPLSGPHGGYYWHHQFAFEQGVNGRLGLQTEGIYQATPTSPIELTKIAVFWLSGPPLAAELGDIPFPDARVGESFVGGTRWSNIHARFPWQTCHLYQIRFGPEGSEPDGSTWYGAWINDKSAGVETYLGRMLLPADTGQLSPFSVSRTTPIVYTPALECSNRLAVSALFGAPTASGADSENNNLVVTTNRFTSNRQCPTSQFSLFPDAVRHELAGGLQAP